MPERSVRQVFAAGVHLKCPKCGEGKMFSGMFKMSAACSRCNFRFEREMGYFVGAMYINYGATIVVAFAGFFALDFITPITFQQNFILWIAFCVLFPIVFFRYSRSLWLSFDYIVNPSDPPNPRPEGVSPVNRNTTPVSQKPSDGDE